jgi:hypothetical protein
MILLAAGVLAAAARAEAPRPQAGPEAQASPERAGPLRLIETGVGAAARSSAFGAASEPSRRHRLHNVGDKAISAWHFACVHGLPDGRAAWVGHGADAFGRRAGDTLLPPGEAVDVDVPPAPPRESPFAVWTCGPTAAIFTDATSWGAPEALDLLFGQRVEQAREAMRLRGAVGRLREASHGRRVDAEEVSSTLAAALPEDRWGRYRNEIGRVTAGREIGEGLRDLEEQLVRDLDAMLPKLRPEDARRLAAEEGR